MFEEWWGWGERGRAPVKVAETTWNNMVPPNLWWPGDLVNGCMFCYVSLCFASTLIYVMIKLSWLMHSGCVKIATRNHNALHVIQNVKSQRQRWFTCRMSRKPQRNRKPFPVWMLGASMLWRCLAFLHVSSVSVSTGYRCWELRSTRSLRSSGRRGAACSYSCPGEPVQHTTETWSWIGKPPDFELFTPIWDHVG